MYGTYSRTLMTFTASELEGWRVCLKHVRTMLYLQRIMSKEHNYSALFAEGSSIRNKPNQKADSNITPSTIKPVASEVNPTA